MKPQSISEQLMYATTKLVSSTGSTGTGFFFSFRVNGKEILVLITNKHVVNNNPDEKMACLFHTESKGMPSGNIQVETNTKWFFHDEHDLCFTFMDSFTEQLSRLNDIELFIIGVEENLIWQNEKLEELNAIEDVVMFGYPIGLSDEINNFPLFRKGITASHPSIDFNGIGIGAVDMACFPGSSGSPIFILNQGGFSDKKGNFDLSTRVILLGVLFSGPQYNFEGKIEIVDVPTSQVAVAKTPSMINLGYYVKAQEILKFKKLIEQMISEEEIPQS